MRGENGSATRVFVLKLTRTSQEWNNWEEYISIYCALNVLDTRPIIPDLNWYRYTRMFLSYVLFNILNPWPSWGSKWDKGTETETE